MADNPNQVEAPRKRGLPELIRFLAVHMALGMALGVIFVSLFVFTNTAGVRDLMVSDNHPYVAIAIFYIMFALTFASVSMGVAVMTLPWGKIDDMRDPDDRAADDEDDKPNAT